MWPCLLVDRASNSFPGPKIREGGKKHKNHVAGEDHLIKLKNTLVFCSRIKVGDVISNLDWRASDLGRCPGGKQ